MTNTAVFKYSADYPGFLKNKVEAAMATKCIFMQGAAGDMSPNPARSAGPQGIRRDAGRPRDLVGSIRHYRDAGSPLIKGMVDTFHFKTRVDLKNPLVLAAFSRGFFPELSHSFAKHFKDGFTAELNTV